MFQARRSLVSVSWLSAVNTSAGNKNGLNHLALASVSMFFLKKKKAKNAHFHKKKNGNQPVKTEIARTASFLFSE